MEGEVIRSMKNVDNFGMANPRLGGGTMLKLTKKSGK